MKKYLKNIFFILTIIVAIIIFYQFYVTFTFDSVEYYYLSLIIKGEISFSNWSLVRGFSFPLLISDFTFLFGQSMFGLKTGLLLFYVGLSYLSYFVINKFLSKSKKEKIAIYILYLIYIVFNPIIMSYSHSLLTESIMPFILLLSIVLSEKFSVIDFEKNKIKFALLSLYFIFITIFTWFLKQPYVIAILFVPLLSIILNVLKDKNWLNFVIKISVIVVSIVGLIISINVWDKYTSSEIDNYPNYYTNESLLSEMIIRSIKGNYRYSHTVTDEDTTYDVYEVYDTNDNLIDTTELYYEDNITSKDAIKFYVKNTFKRPFLTLDSYYRSYMSTIDLFDRDINTYEVTKGFNLKKYLESKELYNNEIRDYGLQIFERDRSNFSWESANIYVPDDYKYMEYIIEYKEINDTNATLSNILTKYSVLFIILFIISYLLLPFALVYSIIKYIKTKYNNKYFYTTMLFGVAYANLIAHVLMGTILDRYIYPGFPLILLGYILLIINNKKTTLK